MAAFGDGEYRQAVKLLREIRGHAHRFGGSHAQRDLIDLSCSKRRCAATQALALGLAVERRSLRPAARWGSANGDAH